MLIEFECLTIARLLKEENSCESKAIHVVGRDGRVWLEGSFSELEPEAVKVEGFDASSLPFEVMPHYLMTDNEDAQRVQIRVRSEEPTGKHISFSFV